MVQEEELRGVVFSYYARKDIQKAILDFSKNRETIPRYIESFGKRPDTLEYAGDLFEHVKKGATSFHVSEELWQDPLQLKTEMSRQEQDELRQGWDLLVDIDSKYLDYSKIAAELIAEALEFHNVNYKKRKIENDTYITNSYNIEITLESSKKSEEEIIVICPLNPLIYQQEYQDNSLTIQI